MPHRLNTHVLTVDVNAIYKVDTGYPANVCNMRTVTLQPKVLDWTQWQIKTYDVDEEDKTTPVTETLPQPETRRLRVRHKAKKSGAKAPRARKSRVEHKAKMSRAKTSKTIDEEAAMVSYSNGYIEKSAIGDYNSSGRRNTREETGNSFTAGKKSLQVPLACKGSNPNRAESQLLAKPIESPNSSSKLLETVRGFTISSPWKAVSRPNPSPACFSPGDPCSPSEQNRNLSNSKPIAVTTNKPMFQIGVSSEEDGTRESAMALLRPSSLLPAREKQASFSNNVMTRTIDHEAAVESATDDCIDGCAIDDGDSDWEDSMEESGKSSMDHKFFQRVDSKPNLTSRRSLITLMLALNDRAPIRGNHVSQATPAIPRSRMADGPSLSASPNDSDEAPLTIKGMRGPGLKAIHEVPKSKAQPIITGPNHIQPQAAQSPRTNRRNMLATELTESLRRHLLWERQQKSSTANAVLKRRHTSHDVAKLKQYPKESYMKKSEDVNASSWNQYFSKEASDGYHSKGW
ncbi:hypothetical protein Forpi1262_v017235 [Fusarium oxysporum f. sp. raphani]|uniref:DUF3295 domain-containing protein n=1 Tax=Fusarium oxysporum f. sp. raphani TaxID=96318 RepID=A0A8J5U8N8_FUSOX|nr:hypothetical protein Forpi1262_v017235 [Fusarium oxysporum f. sp. raphani]